MANEDLEFTIKATDQASDVVGDVTDAVEDLDGVEAEVEVDAEDEATDVLDDTQEAVDDLDGATAEVTAEAEDEASDPLDDVFARVDELDGETAMVILNAEAKKAEAEIRSAQKLLGQVDGDTATMVLELKDQASDKLGRINAKMASIDTTPTQGKLGGLGGALSGVAGQFGGFASSAVSAMTTVGTQGTAALGPLGLALAAIAAAVVLVKESFEEFTGAARSARDLAAATALSSEEASRWIAIADDMGLTAEDLQGGLKNIAKSMDQAKWSKYGIDTRDAAGNARDANDIFLDTLDLLSKIPSETERNRVGTELLGKGYQSLAPMIGKTRTEYEDMLAAVEDGQVITDEEQQKAERMRKAQDALGDAFGEVKLAIGELAVGVAPLIEAFAQIISVVGKVSAAVGDFLGSSASMRETIDKIGLDKFVKHLDESGKSVEEMTQFLVSQGFTLDEVKGALEENGLATAENKEATDDAAEATAALNEELQDEAELARDAAKAEQEKSDAMRAAADATFALHDAQRDLNDKLTELPAKLAEAGGNLATIQGLLDDVAQSSGKVSDEQVRLAEETATANGKVLTQTQRLDIWNQSMLEQANTAAPEARQAIIDYVASVNGIPPEKVTEILALLDQGKIDEAQAVLDETSKNRDTTIKADADTKSADTKLAQIEKNNYQATVVVKPDTSWWDKAISSLNSQQQRVGNIGGHSVAPSSVQTINVNLPRGVRYTDISRAMQSHTRRAGRRYAAPAPVVTYARR